MSTRERRGLARLLQKLSASDAELYAEQVQRECSRFGCVPAATVERGDLATLSGRITRVVFTAGTDAPVLEAELFDGTARIDLVWLGRRRIVGIDSGRQLLAAGRVALRDGDRKVIYNPWYQLQQH